LLPLSPPTLQRIEESEAARRIPALAPGRHASPILALLCFEGKPPSVAKLNLVESFRQSRRAREDFPQAVALLERSRHKIRFDSCRIEIDNSDPSELIT
jgi:hypothetical protein